MSRPRQKRFKQKQTTTLKYKKSFKILEQTQEPLFFPIWNVIKKNPVSNFTNLAFSFVLLVNHNKLLFNIYFSRPKV